MPTASYVAEPSIKIGNGKPPDGFMEDILQISVEESLHLPGMFTLVINNPYFSGTEGEKPWKYDKILTIGKSISISFTSSTTDSDEFDDAEQGKILDGEITAIETQFTKGSQAPIIVRGYDVSHRLHRGRNNRSFQNMTDSDVVKKIVREVGIKTGTIDSSGKAHDYIFQENQTNMEFLRERAARIGFELFVQDSKLYFRRPKKDATLQLEWLKELHSFRVRVSSAEQVKKVEVRGWDYTKKKAISSTKTNDKTVYTSTKFGDGSKTSSSFERKPTTPTMTVVDKPIFTSKEADTMAQALFDELSGEFVHADGTAEGNPDIRPGRIVDLKDMGNYTGKYYVTETCHFYDRGYYTTEFSVRGLRGGDLFTTLSPPTRLQPGQTLLVGIVSNNNDPKGWGRVRVKFPTLSEKDESNWARVVGVGAGTSRGFDCLPEVNDEVLVAFEHGDIHRPYIIGGVWNGKDKPPEKIKDTVVKGKVRLRTFKTRTGHKLQFVEEDKGSVKKGIYLDSKYGHKLYLNDSQKFIQIKTKSGHYILLDDNKKKIEIKTDKGKSSITMTSTGNIDIKGVNIKMTAKSKISLSAANVDIKAKVTANLKAKVANIKASGPVTVKGKPIKLN